MINKRVRNPYPIHNPSTSAQLSARTISANDLQVFKGKKIISFEQWEKITKPKDRLEFFPNEYHEHVFMFGVPDNFREDVYAWYKNYIELMDFTKNPKYGKRKCRDCLLSPKIEGSYFGLYKFIANALEITEYEDSNNNANALPTYPCQVVNFYSCPYENDKRDGNQEIITRNELFVLNQIAEIIGRTLSKALNIKGTRIIYKIDFQVGKVQEIDTFLCGDKYAHNLPGGKPVNHKLNHILPKIENLLHIPMTSLDDIFTILTDKEKMNIVFQIGLDKKSLEHKDELIEFFMSIKGNVKKEDLTTSTPLLYYVGKNKCSICSQPANIDCINCIDKDMWLCVNHWKDHETNHH